MTGNGTGSRRMIGLGLLLVVFVAGLLGGAAVDRVVVTPGQDRRVERNDGQHRRYVIDQVNLTPAQRDAIDAIFDRRAARMRALWQPLAPRLDAISDSTRAEIMQVLTPQQRADYERLLEQRQARARARRRERTDTAGPAGSTR